MGSVVEGVEGESVVQPELPFLFFISNSIFDVSLELLTDFAKTRLNVA